jgi:hypothetical protein
MSVSMPSVYDRFTLVSDFELAGDQARAIGELTEGLDRGDRHQVLLGVTGSGKTFTMAQTIARVNRPTLVMVHNKTLAAQLFRFRRFPDNAVSISSATTILPAGSYMPGDRLTSRRATIKRKRPDAPVGHPALFEHRDVIIVASVSASTARRPEAYYGMMLPPIAGRPSDATRFSASWSRSSASPNDHDSPAGPSRARRCRGRAPRTKKSACVRAAGDHGRADHVRSADGPTLSGTTRWRSSGRTSWRPAGTCRRQRRSRRSWWVSLEARVRQARGPARASATMFDLG